MRLLKGAPQGYYGIATSVTSIKSGAGVWCIALKIRLWRTQISRPLIVFLAHKFTNFAPFGAWIQEHRTNSKNGAQILRTKLYSSTFLTVPPATFIRKVTEVITFLIKVTPLTLFDEKVKIICFMSLRAYNIQFCVWRRILWRTLPRVEALCIINVL